MTHSLLRKRSFTVLGYLASLAITLTLWQYFSSRTAVSLLFPSPISTLRAGVRLIRDGQLFLDTVLSLRRIAIGFAIGSVLGIGLGVLMGSFRLIRLFFDPYVQFFRSLPALAWIPAAMLWFGTGEASKVVLLVYTTVFVVALNTMIGVSTVTRNQIRAAQCFGADSWQLFYMVRIPHTVSYMLDGMQLAMGNCFSTIVAAELLAPKAGLGYLIFSARTWMQTELAFVGIVMLGLLGLGIDQVFRAVTAGFCSRYLPTPSS